MNNAERFINSYNKTDLQLRKMYDYKPSLSFSEVVRRAAEVNPFVRRYENHLIDYGRLRNAIVHKEIDGEIIAQPVERVTQELEHIARVLCTPPTVKKVLGERNVVCVRAGDVLRDAVRLAAEEGHSNLPVVKDGVLIGVLGSRRVVRAIGSALSAGKDVDEFLSGTTVETVLSDADFGKYYAVVSAKASVQDVAAAFENNRKLLAIVVTADGGRRGRIISLITPADLVTVNKILEDY